MAPTMGLRIIRTIARMATVTSTGAIAGAAAGAAKAALVLAATRTRQGARILRCRPKEAARMQVMVRS
ncbi:hypothetical protein IG631_13152 [Alternaria alternata]|nr:hypothetical protein IG631_13152 [Alternaria alternata]